MLGVREGYRGEKWQMRQKNGREMKEEKKKGWTLRPALRGVEGSKALSFGVSSCQGAAVFYSFIASFLNKNWQNFKKLFQMFSIWTTKQYKVWPKRCQSQPRVRLPKYVNIIINIGYMQNGHFPFLRDRSIFGQPVVAAYVRWVNSYVCFAKGEIEGRKSFFVDHFANFTCAMRSARGSSYTHAKIHRVIQPRTKREGCLCCAHTHTHTRLWQKNKHCAICTDLRCAEKYVLMDL